MLYIHKQNKNTVYLRYKYFSSFQKLNVTLIELLKEKNICKICILK